MPKHVYWITLLLNQFPALKTNAKTLGDGIISTFTGNPEHPGYRSTEPVLTSFIYMLVILLLALVVRSRITHTRLAAVPSEKLTLVTFFEIFFGYFYQMARDIMGVEQTKRYFSLVAGAAAFIFFSNIIGLVPGFSSPTSSLNVTLGCAICSIVIFTYAGLRENGFDFIAHLAGPKWYLAPLVFTIEFISTFVVRPITLSVRLMVNIAVDHLLGAIFMVLVTLFIPVPAMFLGILVCIVQTLVFCLLTCVYIGLATEKHHEGHEAHH